MSEFYTVKEVSEHLRICAATVRILVKNGDIEAHIIGNAWRIPVQSVKDYLKRSSTNKADKN